jgi:uncharacterized repeat protein (TIGR04138 family)
MQPISFDEAIRKIVAADTRYPTEAYLFVQEALQHTQKSLGRHKTEDKHVGGQELLAGIREFALKSYGPMVPTLFAEWGIHCCADFGEIVFNMIEHNLATKKPTDSRAKPALPAPQPNKVKAGLKAE